jgi:hypothetical protein
MGRGITGGRVCTASLIPRSSRTARCSTSQLRLPRTALCPIYSRIWRPDCTGCWSYTGERRCPRRVDAHGIREALALVCRSLPTWQGLKSRSWYAYGVGHRPRGARAWPDRLAMGRTGATDPGRDNGGVPLASGFMRFLARAVLSHAGCPGRRRPRQATGRLAARSR